MTSLKQNMIGLNMLAKAAEQVLRESTEPVELDSKLVTATLPSQVRGILDKYGVAVIPLNVNTKEMMEALRSTKFYGTANAIFKEEHQVAEPSEEELRDPVYDTYTCIDSKKSILKANIYRAIRWRPSIFTK